MFADLLREARAARGLSVAELAEAAGTSRAAIADYEMGRKQPRFDTALRLLSVLGQTLMPAAISQVPRIKTALPEPFVARVRAARTTPDQAIGAAFEALPSILESDAELERLGLTFGEVKAVADGVTIAGDPLQVDRMWALRRDVVETLRAAGRGTPEPLRAVGAYAVSAEKSLPPVELEMDFLARATAAGADPARVRHLTSAALAARGYPYLWVPFKQVENYARAVVASRLHGEAGPMLESLTANIAPREVYA